VIALIEALRTRGHTPGVISRGYGASASEPQLIHAASDPASFGDEPVLIAQATGVPVAVGRDRVAAGRLLLSRHACDVIVADDGLQHYPLFGNVEICVIDGMRRFGNGWLLPAGPLREPLSRLESVTFRVCNGGAAQKGEIPMRLIGDSAIALVDVTMQRPLSAFAGQRVHAVAGIGNPARFFEMLRKTGIDVIEHAFADHHAFRSEDLAFDDTLPVLMTSKDAIKCGAFARDGWWQVPVRAQLPPEFFDEIAARL
jgi:tetraacyldisaccharide 4'-kinase